MESARGWMSRTYVRATGKGRGGVSGSNNARVFYITSVIASFAASAATVVFLRPPVTLFVLALVWGSVFGITFLYWMPAKMVAATFGAVLGTGGSDLVAAAGAIKGANAKFESIYIALTGTREGFTPMAVWLFLFTVAVFCLPAFLEAGVVSVSPEDLHHTQPSPSGR